MPNSFITKQMVTKVAGEATAKAPLLQMINTTVSQEFGEASGDTVLVRMSGYGVVTEGETIGDATVEQDKVPIKVTCLNTAASMGIVEESLKLDSFDKDVAIPRGAKIAQNINKSIYETARKAANTAVINGTAGTATFSQLGLAIANVQASRMEGEVYGAIGPRFNALVTDSGSKNWPASQRISQDLYDGIIGNFNGADFTVTQDAGIVTIGALMTGTYTYASTDASENFSTLTASAAQTTSPGHLFSLPGVYAVDEFGDSTGQLFAFCVQDQVTASTAIKVQAIFFTGPKKNVSVAGISALAATNLVEASTSYLTGVVWNQNDVLGALEPIAEFPTESISLKTVAGIPLRMSAFGDGTTGARLTRMDVLKGFKAKTGRAICTTYAKI